MYSNIGTNQLMKSKGFKAPPMTDERASVARWRIMPGMFGGRLLPSSARKQKRKREVPGFHNPLWAPTQDPSTKYHLSKALSPQKSAILGTEPLTWASGGHWPFQPQFWSSRELYKSVAIWTDQRCCWPFPYSIRWLSRGTCCPLWWLESCP